MSAQIFEKVHANFKVTDSDFANIYQYRTVAMRARGGKRVSLEEIKSSILSYGIQNLDMIDLNDFKHVYRMINDDGTDPEPRDKKIVVPITKVQSEQVNRHPDFIKKGLSIMDRYYVCFAWAAVRLLKVTNATT